MSKSKMLYISCPKCGKYSQHQAYSSLNDSVADSYKKIISNEINHANCPSCSNKFLIETGLLYCNHSSEFAVYYHPQHFKEIESSREDMVRMLGEHSHLANPHKFNDWDKFKDKILRLEQTSKPVRKLSIEISSTVNSSPVSKPKKGIFAFLKSLLSREKKSGGLNKEIHSLINQTPPLVIDNNPKLQPARPTPAPQAKLVPITHLIKQPDASSHKLSVDKITSNSTGRTVILITVIMPEVEYSDLLLKLAHGEWDKERIAINNFARNIFPRLEYGATHFSSESEYAIFLRNNCPELPLTTSSGWFKTIGFSFVSTELTKEFNIIQFIEQQSADYTYQRNVEIQRALETAARKRVLNKPKPKSVLTPVKLIEEVANKKLNWLEFQQLLQAHNITKLYHFTDRANLSSILGSGGLLSWYSCKQQGLTIPRPGGSELSWQLDTGKGLADYVRLSFVRDHPMCFVAKQDGRIANEVILEIDPDVIFWESTKFTTMNAAKNGVSADGTLEKLSSMRFNIFQRRYFDLTDEEKPYYQAEVLVHKMLPLRYIINLEKLKSLA